MRSRVLVAVWLVLAVALTLPALVAAQGDINGRVDVFWEQDPETATVSIYFLDALSGLSAVVQVEDGRRFTLVGDYVLYQKTQSGAIMRANANGTLEPHPFIVHGVDTQAVRWVTSPDAQAIAWVRVSTAGVSEAFVAWADGRDLRQLPITSPDAPQELMPLALSNGRQRFFYDEAYQPSSTGPFITYRHITSYNIAAETFSDLPDEPNCPCGAAISPEGRIFARLEAAQGDGPFALHVWDLRSDADILIPASALPFHLGGDLLLNDNATLAVYGVAIAAEEDPDQPERFALVLVDLVAQHQYLLVELDPTRYRTVAFIDDDNALLLTGVNTGGTFKLDLASGTLQPVSDATYLGTVTP